MRKVFPPPSEAAKVSALLDREDALTAQARIVTRFSSRHKQEIERELAEIHRLLEQLGYRRTA
jgi:hypothetical protein